MKVQLIISPTILVEAVGDNHVELFEQLSALQEAFGQKCCGKCKCDELQFVTRMDDEENKYYELRCLNPQCRAVLAYGQHKKGKSLYPKRKDKSVEEGGTGKYLPDNGWMRWDKEKQVKF